MTRRSEVGKKINADAMTLNESVQKKQPDDAIFLSSKWYISKCPEKENKRGPPPCVGGESRMERQPEWSTRPQRNEPFKRLFSTPYGMWNHQSMMILPYDVVVVVAEVVTACMTHGLIAEWVSQGIAAGPGIP
jgi:hypothetical protein